MAKFKFLRHIVFLGTIIFMVSFGQNCGPGFKSLPISPLTQNSIQPTPNPNDPPLSEKMELWYWHHSYLRGGAVGEPQKSMAIIDKAVAAGYTGVAFWDSSQSFITRPGWDTSVLQQVVDYATLKGLKVLPTTAHFGYSNDILQDLPNQAEGIQAKGSPFKVIKNGSQLQLQFIGSTQMVPNSGFEGGKTVWFNTGDQKLEVDSSQFKNGTKSGVIRGVQGDQSNARFTATLSVTPNRLYRVRYWYKTSPDFKVLGDGPALRVFDFESSPGKSLMRANRYMDGSANKDWTQVSVVFNSGISKKLNFYMGIWGESRGNYWVDDITIEETALLNVLRRDGTPLKAYDPDTGTVFTEGTDFDGISDKEMLGHPGYYNENHTPPIVTIPSGSRLTEGKNVAIDHYTVIPLDGGQVGACLSDPLVVNWVKSNVTALGKIFPKDSGLFLGYDEMRHMNTDEGCKSKHLAAGKLLSDHVVTITKAIRDSSDASKELYFWSDMFDPNHNAQNDYYLAEGDITGSWQGLPDRAIIMNWNLGKLQKSLTWFSGKDANQPRFFRQIIAGYYDSGNGADAATQELEKAMGVRGVIGLMYTSWSDDYSQLEEYASAAQAAWKNYRASVAP